jgi:hypothetical protein
MNAEELEARHQIVRAFVEKKYPGRRVTEIVEDAKMTYQRAAKFPHEYVLASMDATFRVAAHPDSLTTEPGVECKIAMLEDGSLREIDATWVIFGRF